MSAASLSDFEHAFEQVYGVQLAGTFVSCALWGVLALQVFVYYMSNTKDPLPLKFLPGWLLILETIHQFLYCVGLYKAAVINFGNPNVFAINFREIFLGTIFQGGITVSAHMFFIYRIWKFGKNLWIVPAICLPLTTFQLALVLVENTREYKHGIAAIPSTVWMTYTAHSINIFLDTSFMFAMIWLLKKENSAAFQKTNSMINRLVILTINTGLVTSLATILTIALFKPSQPSQLTYVFFNILISPLYGNSVLANLNSRDYIRGRRQIAHTGGSSDPSMLELGPLKYGPAQRSAASDTRIGQVSDFDLNLDASKDRLSADKAVTVTKVTIQGHDASFGGTKD